MVYNFLCFRNFDFWPYGFSALRLLGPNVCHFDFLAFAGAICVLACAKGNNSKCLNSTVNLSNLK